MNLACILPIESYVAMSILSVKHSVMVVSLLLLVSYCPCGKAATNDLVAWYRFNNDAADSSGNGHDGIIAGDPNFTIGQDNLANNAAQIGPAGMTINVTNAAALNLSSALTISAWIKSSFSGSQNTIILNADSFGLNANEWGQPISLTLHTASGNLALATTNSFVRWEWHLFTGTWDGSTDGKIRVYYDGGLDAVSSESVMGTLVQNTHPFQIGSAGGIGVGLDDLRFYNRALSAPEIHFLYTNGANGAALPPLPEPPLVPVATDVGTNDLVAWYRFNNEVTDSTGNGHDGTIAGEPNFTVGQDNVANNAAQIGSVGMTVSVTNSPALDLTTALTFSAWIKSSFSGGQNTLILNADGFCLNANEWGQPISLTLRTASGNLALATTNAFARWEWHLFTATWDGTTDGKIRVYYDGMFDSVSDGSVMGPLVQNSNPLTIGPADGIGVGLDDFRLYRRALAASEISILYTNGAKGYPAAPAKAPAPFTNSLPELVSAPTKNVILAASGSLADVQAAVASAAAGGTVIIPAGTNVWSGTLNLSGVSLWGMGVSNTVIVDETPPGANVPLISIATGTSLTRVTQIQFVHGVTNNPLIGSPISWYGTIFINGSSPLFRIDHCFFNYLAAKNIHVCQGEWGVVDHCTFAAATNNNVIEIESATDLGDGSWATPANFGGTNALYVEDCYILGGSVDCALGGRLVFRYNNTDGYPNQNGFFLSNHGTEIGGGRARGFRFNEVYGNTFVYHPAGPGDNFYTAVNLRGGTALVFSNTFVSYSTVANMQNFRLTDNDADMGPWFGATGVSGWDSNSPTLLAGIAGAASNVLYVADADWINDQWVGCTVWNTNNIGIHPHNFGNSYNNGNIGLVISNNKNTLCFAPSRSAWNQIQFNLGDTFVVHQVLGGLDISGRGQGENLHGVVTPTPVWLRENLEPLYFWANSLLQNQGGTLVNVNWKATSDYPKVIVEGRDFYNTNKPDYQPLGYPHPLTSLLAPAVAVPAAASNMAPPAGLKVIGDKTISP
jgi:hypothetical protein